MSKLFSRKLTEALRACPKSQKQIAAEAGLSAAYLTQLKQGTRGNPNLETLKRLAAALGVGMDFLVPESLPAGENIANPANSPATPMDYRVLVDKLLLADPPGTVRLLQNVVRRALASGDNETVFEVVRYLAEALIRLAASKP